MKNFTNKALEAAEMFLIRRGYEIIERTWETEGDGGLVDIVAEDGGAVVFVSVKSREVSDKGFPESTASREELERFAIDWFSQSPEQCEECIFRFDTIALILVSPDRAIIRHHINAMAPGCDIDSEEE